MKRIFDDKYLHKKNTYNQSGSKQLWILVTDDIYFRSKFVPIYAWDRKYYYDQTTQVRSSYNLNK